MIDGLESRMWIENHQRFSACASRFLCRVARRIGGSDPVPVVGSAMALALAASLASLTLGSSVI